MNWLSDPQAWIALVTLTSLEIVLGVDNIIFISILVGRLPATQRNRARVIGLSMAMIMRILLLLSLTWVMSLTAPMFTVFAQEISGRDIILIVGGLFLLGKSTFEIHNSLEGHEAHRKGAAAASFSSVLIQIAILDMVFSLDSVITAVGMANQVIVMVLAIVLAVIVMMVSARKIGEFVDTHPTIKILALSFLIMVGVALIADGFDMHIPKGYIYFSMAFSVGVEMLNLRVRRSAEPVKLHKTLVEETEKV
ncbi:MAG TPA: TerC family protein [bacterium]